MKPTHTVTLHRWHDEKYGPRYSLVADNGEPAQTYGTEEQARRFAAWIGWNVERAEGERGGSGMTDRFDALMVELSEELSSIPQAESDDMIRLSPVERGDRLEVLSDRLADRCVTLNERIQTLTLALALMEQEDVARLSARIWVCARCGSRGGSKTDVAHLGGCVFSLLSDGFSALTAAPPAPRPGEGE